MKCMNCATEIPEAWVKAISSNSCPACGENIYSDEIKELMDELSSALERMPNNPRGVTGWLLANYKVKKIGSAEPVQEFYGQKQNKPNQQTDEQGLKMAHSPVQDFMKRTGVKQKTPDELAEIYKKIAASREGDEVEVPQEEYAEDDPEVEAIAATMSQPVTRKQMQQYKQAQINSEFDHADDRHPAIQEERMIRLQKQNELAGGGVGKINRSS